MAKKDQKSQEKKVLTEWGGWITWGQEFETQEFPCWSSSGTDG